MYVMWIHTPYGICTDIAPRHGKKGSSGTQTLNIITAALTALASTSKEVVVGSAAQLRFSPQDHPETKTPGRAKERRV